jgi:hypothetical protein
MENSLNAIAHMYHRKQKERNDDIENSLSYVIKWRKPLSRIIQTINVIHKKLKHEIFHNFRHFIYTCT